MANIAEKLLAVRHIPCYIPRYPTIRTHVVPVNAIGPNLEKLPGLNQFLRVWPFPQYQNCTIVACKETKECAVIDPGAQVDYILREVKRHDYELAKIWITHGHYDHASGAAEMRQKTGVPIEGPHRGDAFLIDYDDSGKKPSKVAVYRGCTFTPDRWLEDGDKLTIGKTSWKAIHCPGHSPGSIVYYNPKNKFAQVGDLFFRWEVNALYDGGSGRQLVKSVTEKLWPLGSDVRFIPGHMMGGTFLNVRMENIFLSDWAQMLLVRPITWAMDKVESRLEPK
jgi:glyoxylase-like metal-dependent hydrolase (beta-lactamase superfamily II)